MRLRMKKWVVAAVFLMAVAMRGTAQTFAVATIKPNHSGADRLQARDMKGRRLTTRNTSLVDLISFAYGIQARQVIGGAGWMREDRYDVAAVADGDEEPSVPQYKEMLKRLLAERFALGMHEEQREMPAYVLTVAGKGNKMQPTPAEKMQAGPAISVFKGSEGVQLTLHSANMGDFAGFLQTLVLDCPAVDRTGVEGRFDFSVKFVPDDSQFGGSLTRDTSHEAAEALPGLFTALEEQVGLRLEPKKTQVGVMVVDHVARPTEN